MKSTSGLRIVTILRRVFIDLLKELISLESVSGSESAIGDFLFSFLSPYFKVQKIRVKENRFNILAVAGVPRLYFNTHLDTVPIGNNMLREDDEFIYGRGACDAKGSMAAMVCAAISARKKGLTDFGLFFDVGEEDDFCGILKGLPETDPRFVVIGEPTELVPVIGQRGLLGFKLSAKARRLMARGLNSVCVRYRRLLARYLY